MDVRALVFLSVVAASGRAGADPGTDAPSVAPAVPPAAPPADASTDAPAVRRRDATMAQILHGPFQSSRLFAMPIADTVGAYMMSLSGDGSLLQSPGLLTSAGVLAIGFGDIAQLEYRHTAAISITGVNAPVPAVGAQVRIPIPEYVGVPAIGVAIRIGVPREERFDTTTVTETVTDFYAVARFRVPRVSWLTLHGGVRVSPTKVALDGDPMRPDGHFKGARTLYLPTSGIEVTMNRDAKLVGEVAAAPQFAWMPGMATDPRIGYGLLARTGLRWRILPSVIFDGSVGYQMEVGNSAPASRLSAVVQWDIRLGAEVFVPWGALACRAVGVFCD
jgi:hypothetical protein